MRSRIDLVEFERKELTLTDSDVKILRDEFGGKVDIFSLTGGRHLVTPQEYVGNIVLPDHCLVIRPKIPHLNFFLMLTDAYDLAKFRDETFRYAEERGLLEALIEKFLGDVEQLCRRGISKGYNDFEGNLPFLRGRLQIIQDLRRNPMLHHKIYCRYSDFTPDVLENQILRYALHLIASQSIGTEDLSSRARQLTYYFESVPLRIFSSTDIPSPVYTRLNQHYETIVNLAKLVIRNTTLNLQAPGNVKFSSFLVNMNVLFEEFLRRVLRSRVRDFIVRKGGEYYLDTLGKFRRRPDITLKKNKCEILVVDAKYKLLSQKDFEQGKAVDSDVNQIVSYCLAIPVKHGVLVYPKIQGAVVEETPQPVQVREKDVKFSIKAVDLTRTTREGFMAECDSFSQYIQKIAEATVLE